MGLDKHQLAGLDDRERGFSRPVEFEHDGQSYRAILRYEAVRIATDAHPSQNEALTVLIHTLQLQGYRQLKTQMSFRDGVYLGSQELWVEYPDPPQQDLAQPGLWKKIMSCFRSGHSDGSQP
ncbi:hypothetical protein YTPLAS72_35020 [Nitrospira sp.]|nr:hypothetical protein YTPLAS72_35020 [Nitrospira sp.]